MAMSLAVHVVAALVLAGYSLRAPTLEPQAIPLEMIVIASEPAPSPTTQEALPPSTPAVTPLPIPESPPMQERAANIDERPAPAPLPKARPAPAPVRPEPIAATPPPPPAPAVPEAPAQTALLIPHEPPKAILSGEARAVLVGQYAALLHAQIVRHRTYPEQALRRGEEGTVTLRIVLSRDGTLREVKALSDDPVRLVAASLDAVQASVPFPPLPAELGNGDEVFEVAVVYKIR